MSDAVFDCYLPLFLIPIRFISVGYLIATIFGLVYGDIEEPNVFCDFILNPFFGDCGTVWSKLLAIVSALFGLATDSEANFADCLASSNSLGPLVLLFVLAVLPVAIAFSLRILRFFQVHILKV